jgi:hypothetical protein
VAPVDNLLVEGTGILEAPGLGKAEVPETGRVVVGGIDDFEAVGRIKDRPTVSAGVEAARDLRAVVSRLEGEMGAIDILPGTARVDGLGRPPVAEAVGRATRLVWAASPPKALGAVVDADGRVRPGRAVEVTAAREEVGGRDCLAGGGGGAMEVGLKLAGRAGGPIVPGAAREAGTARLAEGRADAPVLVDPGRGRAAREGGGIIDLAEDAAAGAGLEVGRAVLVATSGRGLVKPV